jgi:hypothetical protein
MGRAGLWNIGGDDLPPLSEWIPGLQVGAGNRISSLLQQAIGREKGRGLSPKASPRTVGPTKNELNQVLSLVEAGGIENPAESERGKKR